METISATPNSLKERILSIDVLRGFALMGIVLINLCSAGLPGLYFEGAIHFYKLNPADYYGWFMVDWLVSGKMRCLFSLLFGAGIILFTIKRDEQLLPVAGSYYRRMLCLLVFGLLDTYVILFLGDILLEYAGCGLLLFLFRKLKPKYLLLGALLCLVFLSWSAGTNFFENKEKRDAYLQTEQLLKEGKKPSAQQEELRKEWIKLTSYQAPFSKAAVAEFNTIIYDEVLLRHKSYVDTFLYQAPIGFENMYTDFAEGFWETISAMLLGMALFKLGFFSGKFSKKTYWLIAFISLAIGLPIAYESTWLIHAHSAYAYPAYMDSHSFSPRMYEQVPRLLLPIGYASILILFCISGWFKKLVFALSCLGRMAFTNYLMQNIFYTILFYGHGFEMFARFTRIELFYVVFTLWAVQIAFSIAWLRYFEIGPLEWVWRSITYKKLMPFRKREDPQLSVS